MGLSFVIYTTKFIIVKFRLFGYTAHLSIFILIVNKNIIYIWALNLRLIRVFFTVHGTINYPNFWIYPFIDIWVLGVVEYPSMSFSSFIKITLHHTMADSIYIQISWYTLNSSTFKGVHHNSSLKGLHLYKRNSEFYTNPWGVCFFLPIPVTLSLFLTILQFYWPYRLIYPVSFFRSFRVT